MQISWLSKQNTSSVLLFFGGWGQHPSFFKEVLSSKKDALMLYNYSHLDFSELRESIKNYDSIEIISWSFGVLVAGHYMNKFKNISNAIAINGSLKPVDDTEGIPTKIFKGTLKLLTVNSWEKFIYRMIGNKELSNFFLEKNDRSIEELKAELNFLGNLPSLEVNPHFNHIILSQKDRIFPFQNLMNHWEENTSNLTIFGTQHYPFERFNTWEEILELKNELAL